MKQQEIERKSPSDRAGQPQPAHSAHSFQYQAEQRTNENEHDKPQQILREHRLPLDTAFAPLKQLSGIWEQRPVEQQPHRKL